MGLNCLFEKIFKCMFYVKFDVIKRHVLEWEGGFANHPSDPGGATNKGITLATYRKYFGQERTVEDLKNISDAEWDRIFRTGFYDPMRADDIRNDAIAMLCVDMCWMSGTRTAIKKIQACLGTKADGEVGKLTLGLLNDPDEKATFDKLKEMRRYWLESIVRNRPESKVFLKGWLNRLDSIEFKTS